MPSPRWATVATIGASRRPAHARRGRPCPAAPGSAPGRRPGRSCSPRRCRRSPRSRPWPPAPRPPCPGRAAPAWCRPGRPPRSRTGPPRPSPAAPRRTRPHRAPGAPGARQRPVRRDGRGRHRPDVDAGVQSVSLHPDPVAQQGATGERRAGVDGQHTDPPPLLPQRPDQGRRGRRLAHSGSPGQPDDVRSARIGREVAGHGRELRRPVLDQADHPADRPRAAGADRRQQLGQLVVHGRRGAQSRAPVTGSAGSARHPDRRHRRARPPRFHRPAGAARTPG